MNDLYSAIYDALSSCATTGVEVYKERADPAATFPYVTFTFPFTVPQPGQREDFQLAVDVWHNGNSTDLDALADSINGNGRPNEPSGMNRRKHVTAGEPSFHIHLTGRASVPDPDEKIRRRRLTYRVAVIDSSSS